MEIRKNDVLELEIVDMSENGEGIGKEIRTENPRESSCPDKKQEQNQNQNRDQHGFNTAQQGLSNAHNNAL